MTDLNSVTLIGRVTREISERDFAFIPTGTAKLSVSIAVNKSRKQGDQWIDEASFFEVVCFGKMAESLKERLHKGMQIAVGGSLKQDRWEKDGNRMSKVYVVADSIQTFAPSRANQQSNQSGGIQQTYPNQQARVLDQTFGSGYQNGYSEGQQTFANGQYPEDIPFN